MNKLVQPIRVVCYYRMSSDDQTTSIPQQQNELRADLERKGIEIVRQYDDPGMSGLLPWNKRPGFLKMIRDCERLKDVNAVAVWHSSRFGRFDSLDGAEPKRILRDAGIHLLSMKEGPIDWNTKMGRMLDWMTSEQNNEYSQTLSANVVRGINDRTAAGLRTRGVAPYGYDRLYHSPDGTRVIRISRSEHFRAPLKYGLKLVINEGEAKIVQQIFQQYVAGDSIASICRTLNAANVAIPYAHRKRKEFAVSDTGHVQRWIHRKTWQPSSVLVLLHNEAYVGFSVVGKTHNKKGLNRIRKQSIQGVYPAIIDDDVFLEAQRLMSIKRERKIKPRSGGGSLNGILYCANCGMSLFRKPEWSGRVNKKIIVYYTCRTAQTEPNCGCKSWRAREDELLPVVLQQVMEAIDFETLQRLEAREPKPDMEFQLDGLRKQLAAIDGDIATGTENLLRASTGTFTLLQDRLESLQRERERIANAMTLATGQQSHDARAARMAWLQSVKSRLVTLVEPEGMASACPHLITPTRRQLDTITALMEPGQSGTVIVDGQPISRHIEDDGEVYYVEYERGEGFGVKPAVVTEVGQLRSLLMQLGMKVYLNWVPKGTLFFKLHKAEIVADSGTTAHIFADSPMAHMNALGSSTRGPCWRGSRSRRWSSWR